MEQVRIIDSVAAIELKEEEGRIDYYLTPLDTIKKLIFRYYIKKNNLIKLENWLCGWERWVVSSSQNLILEGFSAKDAW